jgi:phosphatidylglycerophosphate synthase
MRLRNSFLFRCANNPYIRFPKLWDTYFTLPISIPISELLCKTRIKPNTVSVISLLVAFLAAGLFFRGDYLSLILGAIVFQISYILDCADGYIARKKNLASKFGHWIDHTFDEVKKPVLLIALLMGQDALDSVAPWGWIAAILYVFSRVLVKTDSTVKQSLNQKREDTTIEGGSNMEIGSRQNWLFHHFAIVTLWTSIEAQAIVFVIGPVFNAPLTGMLVAAILSIVWFVYVDGYRYWKRVYQTQKKQSIQANSARPSQHS